MVKIFVGLLQGRPHPTGAETHQGFSAADYHLQDSGVSRGERLEARPTRKLLSELRQVPMWQQQGNGKGSADPTEIPKLRHLSKYETMERALEYPGKSNELVVRSLGCSTKSFTSY